MERGNGWMLNEAWNYISETQSQPKSGCNLMAEACIEFATSRQREDFKFQSRAEAITCWFVPTKVTHSQACLIWNSIRRRDSLREISCSPALIIAAIPQTWHWKCLSTCLQRHTALYRKGTDCPWSRDIRVLFPIQLGQPFLRNDTAALCIKWGNNFSAYHLW